VTFVVAVPAVCPRCATEKLWPLTDPAPVISIILTTLGLLVVAEKASVLLVSTLLVPDSFLILKLLTVVVPTVYTLVAVS
jgi:hypothetical protein